jgi:DNA-binding XRE family transcriptional regulator
VVNIQQIRAARAWLGLSQEELADRAGVARRTIIRLENTDEPRSERIMEKLRTVFEELGIEFLFEGRHGVGLRHRDFNRRSTDPD